MLSLDPYLLFIHLGLVIVTFTVCPAVLYVSRTLSQERQSLFLSPALAAGCCLCGALTGFVYWWVLGHMPAHSHIGKDTVVAEYEWYFYSAGSDVLAVAAQTIPRVTVTALAWSVAQEHKIPVGTTPSRKQRSVRDEMHAMMSEAVEEEDDMRVQESAEVAKAVKSKVNWSTVSLWCLALVLGAVSDGVAAFAWDEGY